MPRSFTGRKHTDITLWYDLCSAHMQQGNIKILISLCGWSYVPLICSKGTYIYTSWYKLCLAHMQQGNLHIHFVVQAMSRSYVARELTYTLRGTSYDPLICSKGTYIYTSWYKLCPAHMQQGNLYIHFLVQVMIRSYAARELTYTLRGTSYVPLICSKGTYIYTSWYKLCPAHMQQGNLHIHFVVQVMSRSYAARELTYTLRGTSYVPLICSKGTYIYTSWYKLCPAHMQQGNLHIHFVVQVMSRSYAARELTYTLRGSSYDPLICSKGTYIYTSWYKLCPAHMQQGNLHIHFVVQVMIRSYAARELTYTLRGTSYDPLICSKGTYIYNSWYKLWSAHMQ